MRPSLQLLLKVLRLETNGVKGLTGKEGVGNTLLSTVLLAFSLKRNISSPTTAVRFFSIYSE